jgi:hypothetical protein
LNGDYSVINAINTFKHRNDVLTYNLVLSRLFFLTANFHDSVLQVIWLLTDLVKLDLFWHFDFNVTVFLFGCLLRLTDFFMSLLKPLLRPLARDLPTLFIISFFSFPFFRIFEVSLIVSVRSRVPIVLRDQRILERFVDWVSVQLVVVHQYKITNIRVEPVPHEEGAESLAETIAKVVRGFETTD